jgi:hypothetical protein
MDDGRTSERIDVGVARRDPIGGKEGSGQLVVHELILEQRGEPIRKAEATAESEIATPCDVGDVVADGGVEPATELKGPAVK